MKPGLLLSALSGPVVPGCRQRQRAAQSQVMADKSRAVVGISDDPLFGSGADEQSLIEQRRQQGVYVGPRSVVRSASRR
ncbi:MAG: hypothetical protein ACLR8Y_21340 [Alistipes indistinctus]